MNSAALAQPGTLIHARGREWVVLPESSAELLLARPLGGLDEEIAGILPAIEAVESAAFSLPSLRMSVISVPGGCYGRQRGCPRGRRRDRFAVLPGLRWSQDLISWCR